MNEDEDQTLLFLAVPQGARVLGAGAPSKMNLHEEAATPSVGVSSMGVTHYGAVDTEPPAPPTSVPLSPPVAAISPFRTLAELGVRQRVSEHGEGEQGREGSDAEPVPAAHGRGAGIATGSWILRARALSGRLFVLPRLFVSPALSASPSLAVFVGCAAGLLAAFFVSTSDERMGSVGEERSSFDSTPNSAQIRVSVRDDGGRSLSGVFVRQGANRSVTDDLGVAELSVAAHQGVLVEAECPAFHTGAPLRRTFSPALLRSGAELAATLTCTAATVVQRVRIEAIGCGEVEVRLSGEKVGETTAGVFTSTREVGRAGVERVSVVPLTSGCRFDQAEREVPFGRAEPDITVQFHGKLAPRPAHRINRAKVPERVRPYRL